MRELERSESDVSVRTGVSVGADRLTSWKEVAAYLGREVRTVQRWERSERLPVHRHQHGRGGTIYAFKAELDAWLAERSSASSPAEPVAEAPPAPTRPASRVPVIVAVVLAGLASVASLRRPADPGASPRLATASAGAMEEYRRGRHLLSRGSERGYLESVRHFEAAVRLDPGFAAAHVGLADAYFMLGRHGYRPPAETMPRARASARAALDLDASTPGLQAVLAGLSFYWDWDFPAAEAGFRRALAEEPSSARSHHGFAHFLSAMGRHEEALEASERARVLEPLSVAIHSDAAWFLYRARRYEEALAESRRALELEPGFGSALLCAVSILAKRGDFPAAVAELQGAAREEGHEELLALLEGPDPRATLERFHRWRLERLQLADAYIAPFSMAAAHASLGEVDEAFAWLERAFESRDRAVLLLNVNPGFDPLRSDPRLADLATRVGLPAPEATGST